MFVNLGCGPEKYEGRDEEKEEYIGVDSNPVHDPDVCMDMIQYVEQLNACSVDAFRCVNCLSMLTGIQIFVLFNEMHRTLKMDGYIYIEQMLVHYEGGSFNAKAWTTPLDQTHWSIYTLKCFQRGATQKYRGVRPWLIQSKLITVEGVLKANLKPVLGDGHEEATFERWLRSVTQ